MILNTGKGYRLLRPVTSPLRLSATIYLILNLVQTSQTNVIAFAGNVIAIGLVLVDHYKGDIQSLTYIKRTCSYTVERTLPGRIFLCRRHGDAVHHKLHQPAQSVDQVVTGMGNFPADYMLIAEVRGIVIGLRPVTVDEWKMILDQYQMDGRPPCYCGMDVFNEEVPDVFTLDAMEDSLRHRREIQDHLKEIQHYGEQVHHQGVSPQQGETNSPKGNSSPKGNFIE